MTHTISISSKWFMILNEIQSTLVENTGCVTLSFESPFCCPVIAAPGLIVFVFYLQSTEMVTLALPFGAPLS